MAKFRNKRTGRVVDVPTDAPTRQDRPKRDKQWSDHLNRMERSTRWDRVPDNTPVGMPSNPPSRKDSKAPADPYPAGGTPGEKWTVAQLDAWAVDHEVDLSGADTKGAKLDLIAAATADDSGGGDPGADQ